MWAAGVLFPEGLSTSPEPLSQVTTPNCPQDSILLPGEFVSYSGLQVDGGQRQRSRLVASIPFQEDESCRDEIRGSTGLSAQTLRRFSKQASDVARLSSLNSELSSGH